MTGIKLKAFIGLLFATLFWGMSYVFSKGLIESGMNNTTIVFFRSVIASVTLLVLMFATKNFSFIKREHLKSVMLLSLFQPFLYFIFELYSMRYNSPVLTSLIISLVPLFVPFALWITERTKVASRTYIAIIMSIVGVSIILLSGQDGYKNLTTDPIGVVLAFLATFCAVLYSLVAKRVTQNYGALVITTYQNIFGMILFAPLFLTYEWGAFSEIPLNEQTITYLLTLGVLCSAIAYMFYLNAVKYLGVMVATITNNISPIFTVIGAFLIFGQTLYPIQLLGVAITVGSLFVGTFNRKKSE